MSKVFGWISPSGEFASCKSWEHLTILLNHREFMNLDGLQEIRESLQSLHDVCSRCAENDEPPEWHNYENAQMDANESFYEIAYRAGFVRVGQRKDELYFQGFPEGLKKHKQKCVDLAEGFDLHCQFEPIK